MRLLRSLLAPLAILVLAGAGFVLWLRQPYKAFGKAVFLTFEHGTGTREMANALAQAGVIRSPWEFLLHRATHPHANLQAGEYMFEKPATTSEIFSRIERGDVFHFDFTVPEGSNIFDVGRLVEEAGIGKADDFLKAARDPSLIRDLAPKATSLEGFLFPSTYRLTHSSHISDLCHLMTQEFRRHWTKLTGGGPRDVNSVVTLASLVEKETGVADERPLVASVFTNRLSSGMKLECDPTTIYAAMLDGRYNGVIHRSDLDSKNPYNTYQHEGLPPGPIANPGAGALEAALHPAETKFIFFVAKASGGGHHFSTTLAEHNHAVAEYRQHAQPSHQAH